MTFDFARDDFIVEPREPSFWSMWGPVLPFAWTLGVYVGALLLAFL